MLKIPSTGLLKTSSPEQFGWAKDFYEFYSMRGRRVLPDSGAGRLIWGKLNGESSSSHGKGQYEEFFVSTGEQYRDQMNRATPRFGTSRYRQGRPTQIKTVIAIGMNTAKRRRVAGAVELRCPP